MTADVRLPGLVQAVASWSAQGQPSVRRITWGFAPEIVGDVRGKAFAITIVDNDGGPDLAGVSYPLDRIPPCSAWPLNMLMDQGSFTIGWQASVIGGLPDQGVEDGLLGRV